MRERELFSGLDTLFIELSKEWIKKYDLASLNKRVIFSAPVIAYLFIMQKISNRNTLASALEYLKEGNPGSGIDKLLGGSRRIPTRGISSNTGGISSARTRITEEQTVELFKEINLSLAHINRKVLANSPAAKKSKWYLLDGTMIGLQNTAKIKERFPSVSNQNGECLPNARVVFVHNLNDAIAEYPAIGNVYDSEQVLANQVMASLPPGSGVIGDANFGVFSVVYQATKLKLKVLARMSISRARALIGKEKITKDGLYDVEWTPSHYDRKSTKDIPESEKIRGKLCVATVQKHGFRSERMFFFTSDLKLSAEEIVALYKPRWLIENDIRTLKKTIHLDIVNSRTPEMVVKEILFGIIAYNMVRALIARGAARANLKPRDISFTRAIGIIKIFASQISSAKTPLQAHTIIEQFYKDIKQIRHPTRRKIRFEPRALVSSRKARFPSMKTSRAEAKIKMLSES